jgi:Family of unknown function (DUF6444)/zinc-finger binding domain of transposase IS66
MIGVSGCPTVVDRDDDPVSMVDPPSYEQLALFVVELTGRLDEATTRLDEAAARIAALEAEVAALRARLGKDSTNSSTPPSVDPPAAKAKRKAVTSQRVRSKDRKRGGQVGRQGSGLEPTRDPDETRQVEAAVECSGCGADLVEHGSEAGATWAQVWDLRPIELEKIHYVLPKRRCGCCGTLTTAAAPFGSAGSVSYGPNVNAAAILLSSQGNVPVEATARLMAALLGVPVSKGFVARAHERFADLLAQGGFDEAMIAALRAEAVLCGDEFSGQRSRQHRPRRAAGHRLPARGHGAHPGRETGLVQGDLRPHVGADRRDGRVRQLARHPRTRRLCRLAPVRRHTGRGAAMRGSLDPPPTGCARPRPAGADVGRPGAEGAA